MSASWTLHSYFSDIYLQLGYSALVGLGVGPTTWAVTQQKQLRPHSNFTGSTSWLSGTVCFMEGSVHAAQEGCENHRHSCPAHDRGIQLTLWSTLHLIRYTRSSMAYAWSSAMRGKISTYISWGTCEDVKSKPFEIRRRCLRSYSRSVISYLPTIVLQAPYSPQSCLWFQSLRRSCHLYAWKMETSSYAHVINI